MISINGKDFGLESVYITVAGGKITSVFVGVGDESKDVLSFMVDIGEDIGKKEFKRLGLDDKMPFGKHKGLTISHILTHDVGYITWLKEKSDVGFTPSVDELWAIKK